MNAEIQSDTFSHARPDFAERLGKLSGQIAGLALTPHSGGGSPDIPDAHALAAALAFARRGQRDIGPEIVAAIYCECDLWRPRITAELASALIQTDKVAQGLTPHLLEIARACYESVVHHQDRGAPEHVSPHKYRWVWTLGTASLWNAASNTLAYAARAYHANGHVKSPTPLTRRQS